MIKLSSLLQLTLAGLAGFAAASFTTSSSDNTLYFSITDSTLSVGYLTGASLTPISATGIAIAGTASIASGTGLVYMMDYTDYLYWETSNPFPSDYITVETIPANRFVTVSTSFAVASHATPYLVWLYCPQSLNPSGCGSVSFDVEAVLERPGSGVRLSLGAIVGIAVASIAFVIPIPIFIFRWRRKSRAAQQAAGQQQVPPPAYPQYPPSVPAPYPPMASVLAPFPNVGPAVPPPYPVVPQQQMQPYPYDPRASYVPPPTQQQPMYDPRVSWLPPATSMPGPPVAQQGQPGAAWAPGATASPAAPTGLSGSGSSGVILQAPNATPNPPVPQQQPQQQLSTGNPYPPYRPVS